MIFLLILLVVVNLWLLFPVAIFAVEIFASLLPARDRIIVSDGDRPDVAILVPAHQEESGIAATVVALCGQLRAGDRLLVVADNCTDGTAAIARAAGAEVVERHDPVRRGKGYALDFGVRHLEQAPVPVVIVVDADCTLTPGSVDRLAGEAAASGRPVQGLYLMTAPPDGGLNFQVAEFAFLIKNRVRPAGLHRLGLPCHLTGSGMAFPWETIRTANLAHASLVEDMKLGLDLALSGQPPLYCGDARIDSFFPYTTAGAATQRSRWEEGHVGMIALVLGSLPAAIAARSLKALALALDILVPPLTLIILLIIAAFVITAAVTWLFGLPGLALYISMASLLLFGLSAFVAWFAYGRDVLSRRALMKVVPYLFSKLKLYGSMATGGRSKGWVRTDRKRSDS
ncbi:glycosyltransferase family 2 protein [Aquamicrobium lusatiense]|uniref:glycosyltransferase family 2 protein n=1 Tax=Aquamicrobium lusatiense TaxID=89772 RepID=UPI002457C04F|nr:glycosyltransferase family 2 protein [Aquamicrobium lusatiense]MDH4989961.1 glycosyltransferase family 2 protein [Aquamicrobium lusatiense]